ncbi:MACPF domain-containing protein At1g14780-like [Chenopodium quinoa]|uniref:MACPF domain-containing protein n=1 Tax=Chenopodium quinoa TaxID=63459 RepID=A0A803LZL2_CHEQI|nr:MACPF domain-containing protein At1g14780-like [Chenopodium quinoa]
MEDWGEERENKPIELRAVESLGLGFDLTSDFRLKFAKKERLVVLDEAHKRNVVIPGGNVSIPGVSVDIRCDKGEQLRFKSDVLQFNQMSELLNQRSSVQGKVPSGYFNAIFNFSGAWLNDASDSKHLAFDGYFVALYHMHLMASAIVLHDKVKKSVPSHWDPASLARFIHKYGTHIIVGLAVGGQDLICVRQAPISEIPPAELRAHLEDLGDALFSDGKEPLLQRKAREGQQKAPEVFSRILQSNIIQLTSVVETSNKDGLSVIRSRRGGNVFLHSHSQWLQTVPSHPDAILFKFVPITSLLTGIPGSGYLSHAINLYLRYKPSPDDLQYFLEFQVPRQWAPMYNELPLQHQRIAPSSSLLQFSLFGPKIHVNSTKVTSSLKPIVGLRLYLEGKHCNQLAIHAQHLTTLPNSMTFASTHDHGQWRGSDDFDPEGQFLECVRWKRFSKVCTSIVKHDPNWLQGKTTGVFIVTGAQLLTKGRWPKTALHLRLLFSHLPNCTIRRTEWAAAPQASHKSSILMTLSTTFTFTPKQNNSPPKKLPAALNSGVYPNGPPVPVNCEKLLRFVDTSEVLRGPHDAPGHWLVTAAKLVTDGGKIGLHVKFALIDYTSDL